MNLYHTSWQRGAVGPRSAAGSPVGAKGRAVAWSGLGFLVLVAALAPGCGQAPGPKGGEKPKVESELARTTLSAEACRSLRIRSEPIRTHQVQDQTQLTGWIMAPQGHEVSITAPVAGYIRAPRSPHAVPIPGSGASEGQELFQLEPVLTAVEQIQMAALKRGAETELAKAKESVQVADSELKRIQDLYKQGLRGLQDLEQAKARLAHAQEDLASAEDKIALFGGSLRGDLTANLKPITLRSPRAGTVLAVPVSPGQYISAAAPVATVADLSRLWVRVPVPENDLPQVAADEPVSIMLKPASTTTETVNDQNRATWFHGRPIAVVPQVDLVRHTADLLYELSPWPRDRWPGLASAAAACALPGEGGCLALVLGLQGLPKRPMLAKDQMVTVFVPLGERREETVLPYEAVLYDAYGGAWIYLDRTPSDAETHVYERRRIQVGPRVILPADLYQGVSDGVVIHPRIAPDDHLRAVTAGAAALFSREFHKPPL